jgi:hypothetical protein
MCGLTLDAARVIARDHLAATERPGRPLAIAEQATVEGPDAFVFFWNSGAYLEDPEDFQEAVVGNHPLRVDRTTGEVRQLLPGEAPESAVGLGRTVADIIARNEDLADFTGPAPRGAVEAAEARLALELPSAYRDFVERYGCGTFAGRGLFGIGDLSVVVHTVRGRHSHGVARDRLVVSREDDGTLDVLDRQGRVFEVDGSGREAPLADSFEAYLEQLVRTYRS